MSDWSTSRGIAKRVVVKGVLRLTRPAHLGNGDAEGLTDMPLLLDPLDRAPLLTGTTIAGALRNYVRARERGHRVAEEKDADGLATLLFGGVKGDDNGDQSPLIVEDARANAGPTMVRDGVKIDYRTRTAQARKKYDLELLPAGPAVSARAQRAITRLGRVGGRVRDPRTPSTRGDDMSLSSSQSPTPGRARRTIATYTSYREAERAVDWLSDQGFAVQHVAIVGTGLRSVEQVAGRVTTGRAALTGAVQGALMGLLFALLFGLFFTGPGFLGLLVYAVVAGAVFGAIFGALAHAAWGGRRDFASARTTEAERYEVQVDEAMADEAQRLIDAIPTAR
jgi:hypothetical protein